MTYHCARLSLVLGLTLLTTACAQDLPSGVLNNSSNQSSTGSRSNLPQVTAVDPTSNDPSTTTPPTTNPLILTLSSTTPPANSAVTLTASGGTAPYVYRVASTAVGSLVGSTFFTAAIAETVTLTVTDSVSASASLTLTSSAPESVVIYRYSYGLTHFFSTSNNDSLANAMNLDGSAYRVLKNSGNNTQALYRCQLGSFNFETTDRGCEGGTQSAALGFVYATKVAGSTELYRFVNRSSDHIDTADLSIGGYTREGVLGYVPVQ